MSNEDYRTYRVVLSGRVQGVGFRYFAEDQAQNYNIKGYVKNTYNNKVEVLCQGKQKELDLFILMLKKGPTFANVTEIKIDPVENPAKYEYFEVRY